MRRARSEYQILHDMEMEDANSTIRFQKLQLEHVQDYGCQGAIEFR
jgi:hypothetical protein